MPCHAVLGVLSTASAVVDVDGPLIIPLAISIVSETGHMAKYVQFCNR